MEKDDIFLTTAPKKKQITIENEMNLKTTLENSVNKHKKMEEANISITGDEIKQQNENL
ncbi:hypothetical protein SAMN05880501_10830 [Ureibacillus xyleni]|uniref:Uncharacterized protein n=1 Tax=Ureibacillus xyleni TaxID=614648 RepID=A0A285T1E5_9BACL|nr:hypothetical protein [Ureibacillus xyleni]SOC15073.1 hypothetical protein SAMN05880501_10830 [Ureibacillus xyleni]